MLFTVRAYPRWEQHPPLSRLTNIIVSSLAISAALLSIAGRTCDCNMANKSGRLISAKAIGDKINFHFILALNSAANLSQKHPGRVIILIQFPGWLCKP